MTGSSKFVQNSLDESVFNNRASPLLLTGLFKCERCAHFTRIDSHM